MSSQAEDSWQTIPNSLDHQANTALKPLKIYQIVFNPSVNNSVYEIVKCTSRGKWVAFKHDSKHWSITRLWYNSCEI